MKEYDLAIEYLDKFDSLIKDQKATSKAHINTFLISEATTVSEFNTEVDKFSTIYSPLEIANLKEAKANNAYDLKIRNETRDYKENRKYNFTYLNITLNRFIF